MSGKYTPVYLHISDIFRIFIPMKEQVTDMSQALKGLTSEMASMREGMDAMRTENANLRRNVEKLRAVRLKIPSSNHTIADFLFCDPFFDFSVNH